MTFNVWLRAFTADLLSRAWFKALLFSCFALAVTFVRRDILSIIENNPGAFFIYLFFISFGFTFIKELIPKGQAVTIIETIDMLKGIDSKEIKTVGEKSIPPLGTGIKMGFCDVQVTPSVGFINEPVILTPEYELKGHLECTDVSFDTIPSNRKKLVQFSFFLTLKQVIGTMDGDKMLEDCVKSLSLTLVDSELKKRKVLYAISRFFASSKINYVVALFLVFGFLPFFYSHIDLIRGGEIEPAAITFRDVSSNLAEMTINPLIEKFQTGPIKP